MRFMSVWPYKLGRVLMMLTVASACGGPSTVATTGPTPGVFDDRFGILIGNSVRSENSPQSLFVLGIDKDAGGVVSPDGRRLAYWAGNELRVIDIAPGAQPRTVVAVPADEAALYFVWSSDG